MRKLSRKILPALLAVTLGCGHKQINTRKFPDTFRGVIYYNSCHWLDHGDWYCKYVRFHPSTVDAGELKQK